jgi:hypothetical protein
MPSVTIFSGGNGRGDVAAVPLPLLPPLTIFNGGTGRGDVAHIPPTLLLPNAIFSGGAGRGDDADTPEPLIVSAAIFSGGTGRGDVFVLGLVDPAALALWVRAYLEGAYDGFAGMHDIPLAEPYSAMGFPGGGETIDPSVLTALGNNVVVDWVQVQLRGTEDPSTPVSVRNGLVLANGFIVDTDGVSPLQFSDVAPGSYHVAVLHRNHLGCMTLDGVPVNSTPSYVDFTLPYTPTYGVEARKPMGIAQVLWAGDVNHDGQLKYTGDNNDRDPILSRIGGVLPTATATGYHAEDVNLDGTVKYSGENNDRDPILQNIGGTVPTNTREGQLP